MSSFLKGSIANERINQSIKVEPTHLAFFVNLFSRVLFNGLFIFSSKISAIIACYASTIHVFSKSSPHYL
jgi:hypothetical protein